MNVSGDEVNDTQDIEPLSRPPSTRLSDRGFVLLQRLLPQRLLTRIAYRTARLQRRWWTRRVIPWFIRRYGVDMDVAEQSDPRAYPHFNAFFTRALRHDARPIAAPPDAVISPVDGSVYQAGYAQRNRLLQAKGHAYTLENLLGGDAALAAQFHDGPFVTLYLAPRDYHRVHMPVAGRLRMMRYLPGRLFSVNRSTTLAVPGLFARNERLVTVFDTPAGPMALVLVGAMLVSAIETVWSGGIIHPGPGGTPRMWEYEDGDGALVLERGEEMGRFNMGSTVIVLFGRERVIWMQDMTPTRVVRMGQWLGTLQHPSPA